MAVRIKTPQEIEAMREAGRLVANALHAVKEAAAPGVTTRELDQVAEDVIVKAGAIGSFRGVPSSTPGAPDYPAVTCISLNSELVHGLPGDRVLADGDLVSVDVGVILDGWHGDAAISFGIGSISTEVQRLMKVTEGALAAGIAKARAGGWLGDISAAIQKYAESRGYSVVRDYTGHGIGREMWEGFQVPNFGAPRKGLRLRAGMTMAIEPMLNVGSPETMVLDDGWTVVTRDGKLSAHFEHTIAVTESDPVILTIL